MSDKSKNIEFIQLSNYQKPTIVEEKSKGYVLNGRNNEYFTYVNNRYIGSPTNSAIINGYCSMMYGNGLSIKDANNNLEALLFLKKVLKKTELKKIIKDFRVQGMAYIQVQKNNGGEIIQIAHGGVSNYAPSIANEKNQIESFWYSQDFSNTRKYTPEEVPVFGTSKKGVEVYCIKPYSLASEYFSLPKYQSGLPFAELEEEIGNYSLNHIKKGLAFGYVVNFNDSASYTDEQKEDIKSKIKRELTGSDNAGAFILSFNDNKENGVTIEVIQQNNSHKQWESLQKIAQEKILVSHEVVSSMLFGVANASGFSSNADEIKEAHRQTMLRVIKPEQDYITDALEEIMLVAGFDVDLYFKDFTDTTEELNLSKKKHVCLNANVGLADELISLGEDLSDYKDYYCLSHEDVDYDNDNDDLIQLASTGTARPNSKSEQDSKDIVIRYRYVGARKDDKGERDFCQKMLRADKLYRKEDIQAMKNKPVNKGFGLGGSDTYDIWLWKGGGKISDKYPNGTCKHKWNRVIFLKKNGGVDVNSPLAERITTSEARKRGYKVPTNDSRVSIAPHNM